MHSMPEAFVTLHQIYLLNVIFPLCRILQSKRKVKWGKQRKSERHYPPGWCQQRTSTHQHIIPSLCTSGFVVENVDGKTWGWTQVHTILGNRIQSVKQLARYFTDTKLKQFGVYCMPFTMWWHSSTLVTQLDWPAFAWKHTFFLSPCVLSSVAIF